MADKSNFWDQYEEAVAEEGGSGGIVSRVKVETGYKVYAAGLDQEDTWFPANPSDEDERAAAKAKAQEIGTPQWGIQIQSFVESAVVRGEPATWKGDRFFNVDSWTSAAKEVVVPSLKNSGIRWLPWEGWARIGFQDNPYHVGLGEAGKTDEDADGNPRYPQVAYIVETFQNKEEALQGVASSGGGSAAMAQVSAEDVPEGWDEETWKSVWPDFYEMQQDGESTAEIAKAYDVPVRYVVKALNAYIPM